MHSKSCAKDQSEGAKRKDPDGCSCKVSRFSSLTTKCDPWKINFVLSKSPGTT